MNSTVKKIIIGAVVLIVIIGIYFFTSNNSQTTTTISSSGLSTQSGGVVTNLSDQITKDTSFIATLFSLNKIQIDTSILQSVSFQSLTDNTVDIVNDGLVGRVNPFSPFDVAPANTSTTLPNITNGSAVTPTSTILPVSTTSNTNTNTNTLLNSGSSTTSTQKLTP